MPVTPPSVRRHRGKELILLHRFNKVVSEILAHNARYPQAAPPAPTVRRHLEFTSGELTQMVTISSHAVDILLATWPPAAS